MRGQGAWLCCIVVYLATAELKFWFVIHRQRGALLCRRVVTRGWTEPDRRHFDDLSAGTAHRRVRPQSLAMDSADLIWADTAPHPTSIHLPIEYPLPSSFPSLFQVQNSSAGLRHTTRGILTRTQSMPMVSALASGYSWLHLFT
jgi:hypothetical protein